MEEGSRGEGKKKRKGKKKIDALKDVQQPLELNFSSIRRNPLTQPCLLRISRLSS